MSNAKAGIFEQLPLIAQGACLSGAPLVANPESRPKYAGSIRIFQVNKQPG
jgi:hypothetical protein